MRTRRLRTVVGLSFWMMALWLAGCHSAQQPAPTNDPAASERADAPDEARGVADASLGKQSEILAHGDLALNGREQLLVVNRFSAAGAQASKETANSSPILVTRAAVLEKDGGKWSEILRCDEHLKNPNGYLGGIPAARVSGWRLEYTQDAKEGLEMKFSPAERFDTVNVNVDQNSGRNHVTFEVRWNKNAKRYQSYDQSHERYLSEVPSLETPASTLR
jgi:hypothetical protein